MKNKTTKKITMSFELDLLDRIAEHRKLTGASQVGFFRVAAERLLRDEEQAKMRQHINRQVHPRQGDDE